MKTTKHILDPNLGIFVQMVVDAALQGWEIQEQNPPTLLGYCYETIMERDEEVIDPPAKLTREEIAAKARQAKADKKAAKELAEKPAEKPAEQEKTPATPPADVAENLENENSEQPKEEPVSEERTQISDKPAE